MTWGLTTIAVLLLVFAAISARLGRLNITAAMFFTTAGLLAGPSVWGLLEPAIGEHEVKLLAEITLTLVLFGDASRISLPALRGEYVVPLRLLGIGLPLTIAAGAVAGVAIIPGLSPAESLVLAVILACTDAALGQAVVTDERVPSRIRQGLNVESGLNDGLCVPLFFIAIAIAEADAGTTSGHAALELVVEQLGYGMVGGVVAGVAGALALRAAGPGTAAHWVQILTAATALLAAGVALGLGGSIFIAAFTGGLVFAAVRRDSRGEVTDLVDQGGELFDAVTFIVFGAVVLGPALDELTWEFALYAVVSLTAVRMVPVALAMLGTGARRPTVAFLGWSGPRGLASIVFAVILIDEASLPHERALLLAIVATVGLSVYAHGLASRPLTERYVRWFGAHPKGESPAMESVPAAEHRWRWPGRPG
jgi:NhaP-type Na+/H+ or K+/H+ antiporter